MLAGVACAGKSAARNRGRIGGIARVRGRTRSFWRFRRKCASRAGCRRRADSMPSHAPAPASPWQCATHFRAHLLADGSHYVVADHRLALHPGVDSFQVMIEPADHVVANREVRVGGVDEIPYLSRLPVAASMQPWTYQQLLFAARIRPAVMLAADVTLDRADVHEVVPASEGEARHIHLVEVPRGVFQLPDTRRIRDAGTSHGSG